MNLEHLLEKLDKYRDSDTTGACVILEEYLDGAIADYEDGDVENEEVILSSIFALNKLGDASWMDYFNRMSIAKDKKDNSNV